MRARLKLLAPAKLAGIAGLGMQVFHAFFFLPIFLHNFFS